MLEGAVGAGCAAEFSGFLAVWRELPTVEEILEAPEGVPVPEEPAALYATCEALSLHADQDTMEALATYAARLPAEFGVLLMRDAVERDAALVESPAFARWAEQNAAVLM